MLSISGLSNYYLGPEHILGLFVFFPSSIFLVFLFASFSVFVHVSVVCSACHCDSKIIHGRAYHFCHGCYLAIVIKFFVIHLSFRLGVRPFVMTVTMK